MVKYVVVTLALAAAAFAPRHAFAQGMDCQVLQPRGNLVAACVDIRAAWQKVRDAQISNSGQLGGHGTNARVALEQAYNELLAAAAVANRR